MNVGIDEFFEIDEVCEQFESEWRAGPEPPDLESFLKRVATEQRRDLFECLLPIDLEFRRARELSVPADSYKRTFPDYADLIAASLQLQDTVSLELDTSLTSDFRPGSPESKISDAERIKAQARFSEGRLLIGRYTVLQQLGRGGQGAVYRAAHPTLPIEVAIKVGNRLLDARARQAMMEEAHVLCELDHPNIAKIRDLDFDQHGCPILVLELVRGRSLQQLLDEGSLPREKALALLAEVSGAVEYAHRRGVLHLDLKPQNVVVTEGGQAKVIDFGLARLRDAWWDVEHEEDGISGTPNYMAPEQARGIAKEISAKADIFALGAMLYRIVAGEVPFAATTGSESLRRAVTCDIDWDKLENAAADPALVDICRTAMSLNPAERYESAEAFRAAIQQQLPVHREKDQPHSESVGSTFASRAWAYSAGLALLLVLCMLFLPPVRRYLTGSGGNAEKIAAAADSDTLVPDSETAVESAQSTPDHELIEKFDIMASRENDSLMSLNDEMLPLMNNDGVHFSIKLREPAHVRLIWIDAEGAPVEIYPNDPEVGMRDEGLVTSVESPKQLDRVWPIDGKGGLETALLLVSRKPMDDLDLEQFRGVIPSGNALNSMAHYVATIDQPAKAEYAPQLRAIGTRSRQVDDAVLQLLERIRSNTNVVQAVVIPHRGEP